MSNYMKQFTLTLVSVMGQPETTYSWGKYNCMAGLQFNNFGLNCFTTSILITYIFFLGYISKQVESLDQTFYGRKIIIIIYQIVEDVDDDDVEDDERFFVVIKKTFLGWSSRCSYCTYSQCQIFPNSHLTGTVITHTCGPDIS